LYDAPSTYFLTKRRPQYQQQGRYSRSVQHLGYQPNDEKITSRWAVEVDEA
jgi:hypothetical protein